MIHSASPQQEEWDLAMAMEQDHIVQGHLENNSSKDKCGTVEKFQKKALESKTSAAGNGRRRCLLDGPGRPWTEPLQTILKNLWTALDGPGRPWTALDGPGRNPHQQA